MASLQAYHESILELKHKLLCTTYELESARTEAKEEMIKSEENIKQLLQLLKIACLERDEARNQLQTLLNNGLPSAQTDVYPSLPHSQPMSLPQGTTKANPGFKKSDNLSETYNPSPLDCLLDALCLPDMANSGALRALNKPFECSGSFSEGIVSSEALMKRDSTVIEDLVKGKPLPQKGKLLKAVMEAGPLLQTLLLAGPLPRWQNPPPMQAWQIPDLPIKEGPPVLVDQKSIVSSNCAVQRSFATAYSEVSHRYSQISSSSTSCSAQGSGSFLNCGCPSSDGTDYDFMDNQISTGKRRRL